VVQDEQEASSYRQIGRKLEADETGFGGIHPRRIPKFPKYVNAISKMTRYMSKPEFTL
jgi:hypothetical protein